MTQKRMSNQLMRFVTLLLAVLLCQPTTLPLLAQSAGSALNATIVTVAGGGLFANVAAKQAPLMSPTAVLLTRRSADFIFLTAARRSTIWRVTVMWCASSTPAPRP